MSYMYMPPTPFEILKVQYSHQSFSTKWRKCYCNVYSYALQDAMSSDESCPKDSVTNSVHWTLFQKGMLIMLDVDGDEIIELILAGLGIFSTTQAWDL